MHSQSHLILLFDAQLMDSAKQTLEHSKLNILDGVKLCYVHGALAIRAIHIILLCICKRFVTISGCVVSTNLDASEQSN